MTPAAWISIASFGFALICAMAGALIWFVRLEGRVNANEKLHAQFKELHEKEHSKLGETFKDGFAEVKGLINKLFDRLDEKADKPR